VPEILFNNEPLIRLGAFAGIFAAMALWELLAPRRHQTIGRRKRWPSNLSIVVLDPRLARRLCSSTEIKWIEVDALAGRLVDRNNIAVADVRGPEEFDGPLGHIADAKNLPIGEFLSRLHELDPFKQPPVAVVCLTDERSANAAALLHAAGFDDVRVLRGGMARWNQNGLPVARRSENSGSTASKPLSVTTPSYPPPLGADLR
jgi:rhodanese-related sulfurtransferase